MGRGKARSILAPALFILNLPVALARAPGKIANQAEAAAHAWCQLDTNAGTKTQRIVASVF